MKLVFLVSSVGETENDHIVVIAHMAHIFILSFFKKKLSENFKWESNMASILKKKKSKKRFKMLSQAN